MNDGLAVCLLSDGQDFFGIIDRHCSDAGIRVGNLLDGDMFLLLCIGMIDDDGGTGRVAQGGFVQVLHIAPDVAIQAKDMPGCDELTDLSDNKKLQV